MKVRGEEKGNNLKVRGMKGASNNVNKGGKEEEGNNLKKGGNTGGG